MKSEIVRQRERLGREERKKRVMRKRFSGKREIDSRKNGKEREKFRGR